MTVAVLLAARDGEKYLNEQLRSLHAQTIDGIDVFVGDDGSTDGTPTILRDWSARWDKGAFKIGIGPQAGSPADAFRALVLDADLQHDYFAFADQDDIWLPGKLSRAIAALQPMGDAPALHCSRTQLIDGSGQPIGYSRDFRRPPSFRNALIQSVAGGNTMVMNRAAFALLQELLRRGPCVAHDWWTYQIVSGAGGTVLYSREPDTLYRQHGANAVGSNRGILAALNRVGKVLQGRMRAWNSANIAALERCNDLLTDDARTALQHFRAARGGTLPSRIKHLAASGVYRQTERGRVSLWGACLLNLL